MKRIVLFVFCLLFLSTQCLALNFTWDRNDEYVSGYRLYYRQSGQSYNYYDPLYEGVENFYSIGDDFFDEGTTYFFVVRAYLNDAESSNSNEVYFTFPFIDDTIINDPINDRHSNGGCFIRTLK